MAFLYHKNQGAIVPGSEYLPAGAITPKLGLALTMSGGQLAVASGTAAPTYICLTTADKALTAGDIIPVSRITADQLYATTWSVAASSVQRGQKVTLSADGMEVTATTTSGVAEVVDFEGQNVGDTVYVRFA